MRMSWIVLLSLTLLSAANGYGQDFESNADLPLDAVPLFPASSNHNSWVTGEFLFGWVQGTNLSPLVTSSPVGTPVATAGILGEPTTTVLFSGKVNDELRTGLRIGGGYLFDPEYGRGVEADFVFLGNRSSGFSATSADFPILARPYIDANTGDREAVLIAHPDQSTGSVMIDAESGNYYAVHLDTTERIWSGGNTNVSGLLGYRYGHYDDSLRIQQTIVPNALPDTEVFSRDSFRARNDFHGLDMGLRSEHTWNNLTLNLLGRFSTGYVQREVNIQGSQTTTVGAATTTAVGGVYALSSNIGKHRHGEWVVWPELGAKLNWQVRPNMRLNLGYSAMFLNEIARASDQIDFTVNPELFPPANPAADPLRPSNPRDTTNIWIQTLNLGVDFLF